MLNATKSTSNLLDCSDSEDEDNRSNDMLVAQKSAAWDKMRVSVSQNLESEKNRSMGSADLMPPPPPVPGDNKTGTDISVPETNFDRDFSQLSAFDDDFRGHDD